MTTNNDTLLTARKLRDAEEAVAHECGGFYLFGLFERQQSPGRWDIVASAPWLETDRDGTKNLIALLRSNMDTDEWVGVSAVIPINSTAEYVQIVTDNYTLKHGFQEVYDPRLGDETPGHAFLITADKSPAPAHKELVSA